MPSESKSKKRCLSMPFVTKEDAQSIQLPRVERRHNQNRPPQNRNVTKGNAATVQLCAIGQPKDKSMEPSARSNQSKDTETTKARDKQQNQDARYQAPRILSCNGHEAAKKESLVALKLARFKLQTDIPWIAHMARWLECEQCASAQNARSLLRQVTKLALGKGVSYPSNWPDHVLFFSGRRVDLEFDFDIMLEQAKQYHCAFGEDKGHGWLLCHPIIKMKIV